MGGNVATQLVARPTYAPFRFRTTEILRRREKCCRVAGMSIERDRFLERIKRAMMDLSTNQAAQQIGLAPSTLYRILSREALPGWQTREKIERWCDSRVPERRKKR